MNPSPLKPKASRFYFWLSLAGFFLMALLWGLGKTFIVVFGAIGVGSGLIYYFQWRETQPHPFRQQARSRGATTKSTLPPAARANRFIAFAVIGIVGAFVFNLLFLSPTSQEDATTDESIAIEVPTEETVTETSTDRADQLYYEGDYQGALSLYEAELKNDPLNVVMLINVGNCYYSMGQSVAADGYYQQALNADPKSTSALHNRALINYDAKNYGEAITLLKRALGTDATYGYSWDLLGNCYYDQEKYADAKPCYEKAYQYEIRYVGLFEKLGFLEERDNNIPKAKEYYKEGLLYDETSAYIKERLKELGN